MYEDILVPTDGSESIDGVLEHTLEVAEGGEPTVHVLYVIDDQVLLTLDDEQAEGVLTDLHTEGEVALDRVTDRIEAAGLPTEAVIEEGKPAEKIVEYAADNDVDIITMGTQGDDYTENMLGSTSQKVVTKAPVPVLTVNVS